MLGKTKNRQIKGKCQLTEFAKGVDLITKKFDEYKKDRLEKDAITVTLQSELKSSSMKVEDLEKDGQVRTVLQKKVDLGMTHKIKNKDTQTANRVQLL